MTAASSSLAELLAELHRMSARERRGIIERLDDHDREHVTRLLGRAVTTPPPSFDALASLSPWLAESLAAARSSVRDGEGSALTPAAREALIEAERLLPIEAAKPGSRPSLIDRFRRKGRR